jgi:hypothetical protein
MKDPVSPIKIGSIVLSSMPSLAFRFEPVIVKPLARHARSLTMAAMNQPAPPLGPAPGSASGKKEGDISSVFVSLSGAARAPLPPRFRDIKAALVAGHEREVVASWGRLLDGLRAENAVVARKGPTVVPVVEFSRMEEDVRAGKMREEIRKRGVVVVKGVVDEATARGWKGEVEEYVRQNPGTKGELNPILGSP